MGPLFDRSIGILTGAIIPTEEQASLMAFGASCGAVATFMFGSIDKAFLWLLVFVALDYITGMAAAFKRGVWSSNVGFLGLFKKCVLLCLVALCHGLDSVSGTHSLLRNAAIFAYSVNECGSIIQNIEKLGLGHLIPDFIRRGLKQLQKKESEIFEEEKTEKPSEGTTES